MSNLKTEIIKDIKNALPLIGIILLTLVSIGCMIYAGVMQMILAYEKFGVIFNSDAIFIPHWSAWFYLGGIGLIPAWILWTNV